MDAELEKLTLSTVAKGRLEEMFQQRLIEIDRVLEELPDFESDKDKIVKAEVTLKVRFAIPSSGEGLMVFVSAEAALPKHVTEGDSVFRRKKQGWLVWADEPTQPPLPLEEARLRREAAEREGK